MPIHENDLNRQEYAATYDPEDDKLRLYCGRVERETYDHLRSTLKFRPTPKQDCDFAGEWTISRENACLAMIHESDDIGDEDTPPQERAEDRADRFAGYRDKRRSEAGELADRYDNAPSVAGYQSAARSSRVAAKRDRLGSRAVSQWDKATYWQRKTEGVIRHSRSRSSNQARAGRVEKCEKALRKAWKSIEQTIDDLYFWTLTACPKKARTMWIDVPRSHELYSRIEWPHTHCLSVSRAIEEYGLEIDEAREIVLTELVRRIEHDLRVESHYVQRVKYDQAILDANGWRKPEEPKRPKQPPLLNYRKPNGIMIENQYHRNQWIHHSEVEWTKAEWAKVHNDYKGTRLVRSSDGKQHRIRIAIMRGQWLAVYLTDSKDHGTPELAECHQVESTEVGA